MISAALLGCHQEEIFGNGNRPKQQCFFFWTGFVVVVVWYHTIPLLVGVTFGGRHESERDLFSKHTSHWWYGTSRDNQKK